MPEDLPAEPRPRTAREVIDAAVNENKTWERIGVGLTAATGVTGLGLLIAGAVQGGWVMSGSGLVASALLVPALVAARRSRRENIQIRMSELPLQKAKTTAEMRRILEAAFTTPPKGGPPNAAG